MTFINLFTSARKAGTPLIAVRTPDATSTISNVRKSLNDTTLYSKASEDTTGIVSWDAIHGLKGLNEKGNKEVAQMLQLSSVEQGATVAAPIAFGVIEYASEHSDLLVFFHNAHLLWAQSPPDNTVIQGIANLRDGYKANGNLLVLLANVGAVLPAELQSDVLLLEEMLPTRDEIKKIIIDVYDFAKTPIKVPSKEVLELGSDALIGLPSFTSEQATAMCLEKKTGKLDIDSMWTRKKAIVSQMPGLSFHSGTETLADAAGIEAFKKFGCALMEGEQKPALVLRMDEAEKQLAGNATDTSGVKGDLLGEFLTWVEDKKVICSLLLGIPGSSKSWSTYCIGGQYKRPVINYSISHMQSQYVGTSGSNMRNANRTIDSISDGNVWLCATANSLRGMPPELISRFQVGGIFFFDAPDIDERRAIMNLKIKKYGLDPKQTLPCTEGWTGRDIENCARKAQLLRLSLLEAAQYVVPLLKSHHEEMHDLRMSAHGRFLSANKPGVYEYSGAKSEPAPVQPTVTHGRKLRD